MWWPSFSIKEKHMTHMEIRYFKRFAGNGFKWKFTDLRLQFLAHLSRRLKVSFSDPLLSVVCRLTSVVCRLSTFTLWTRYRPHYASNHHENLSECLLWWNLGHVRIWVMWGQKLGQKAKSKKNLVNTLETTVFVQS